MRPSKPGRRIRRLHRLAPALAIAAAALLLLAAPVQVHAAAIVPGSLIERVAAQQQENRAPEPRDDVARTAQDTPVTIDVLANDRDRDGDTLVIVGVAHTADGVPVINPDQTITYTPAAGFTGTDTFQYTVTDGRGGVAIATVTVHVGVKPAPGERGQGRPGFALLGEVDFEAVEEACEDADDAHPSLEALCRLALGDRLPEHARAVIARVLLKHGERLAARESRIRQRDDGGGLRIERERGRLKLEVKPSNRGRGNAEGLRLELQLTDRDDDDDDDDRGRGVRFRFGERVKVNLGRGG